MTKTETNMCALLCVLYLCAMPSVFGSELPLPASGIKQIRISHQATYIIFPVATYAQQKVRWLIRSRDLCQ